MRHLSILLLAAMFASHSNAQTVLDPPKKYVNKGRDTLHYRFIEPVYGNAFKKYPLVIYLHGSGSRGSDNEAPLRNLPSIFTDPGTFMKYPCFMLIPQCPANDSWVSFPGFPKNLASSEKPTTATQQTLDLIRHLIKTEHIDPDRVYLTGFSLGGEGTFDMISRDTALFACGVPIAALADTSKARTIHQIPLWVFHGIDDDVNHIKYIRLMIKDLRAAGGSPKYTEYPGIEHDCKSLAFGDPGLLPWIFAQKKKTTGKKK